MAILAALYAVCQPVFLPRTVVPPLDVLWVSWGVEPTERAMVVDEATSVSGFLRDAMFGTSSTGGVGAGAEVSVGRFDLRKRGITKVDDGIDPKIGGHEAD